MANRRFIDFPIAASVGDNDIVLIWQDGVNKQTTKATLFAGSPNSLAGLTDVDISALANGQILQYNSTTSKWENVDRTDIDLDQLGDVTIVSPTNGQVLVYNSSTSKWENSSAGFVPYTGAVTTVNLGAQSILAGSFVKAGGTSAQFLKADGSVDSTAYGTGSVTSVGLTMPSAFSVANSPVTTAGTLAVTGAGTVAQYVRGDGSLATFPALTGFVPYTGATADVNLGTHDLTAERGTFQNNGSSDTLTVNHTSGSGYGIKVTKGGNNEALLVTKTSGSGNAMAVVGGRTALVDLSLSSVSNATGNFLTISGGVVHQRTASETRSDVGAQAQLNGTGFVKASGTTISYDNTSYLPLTGGTMTGNVNWALTDRGLTWGFNTDGASIKFYNTGDGDTNSRLEFATLDNDNEYFRWVHIPSVGSLYESMRLVPVSSGNAELIVTGKIIKSGGTSTQFLKADGSVDSTTYVPVGRTITINGTTQDLSANRTFNVGTVTEVTASSPLFSSGGATPNITIQQASGSQSGFLSSTDWTSFNNKANANGSNASGTWGINITGNSTSVINTVTGTNSAELVRGNMGDTDQFRILVGASSSNAGYAEIATADDGTEPIFVRQYTGVFSSLTRSATLLDGSGNTSFPGSITGNSIIKSGGTSSQYLMADGSVSTLSNPITGTGTTNYLPKFTGSTSIGNSNLINDSSGNLGLGVTPSAWTLFSAVLELNGGPAIGGFANTTYFLQNANFDSGFKYKTTNSAGRYELGGQHSWWIAPSGTAGNAITFTQAMTLTTSGNVLIGTTTDNGQRLQVNGDFYAEKQSGNASLLFKRIVNDTKFEISVQESRTRIRTWQTANDRDLYFDSDQAGTTRMVILGGGNVGINTATPAQKLDVYGRTRITNPSNSAQFVEIYTDGGSVFYNAQNNSIQNTAFQHIFYTDGASPVERMRITSGGNVGIATTNPLANLQVGNGTQSAINGAGNKIHIATNGTRSALLTLANSSGGTTVEGQFESSAESADLRIIVGSSTNHPVVFRANNSEAARITNGGNVLIGTTTDNGNRLRVNGIGYFDTGLRTGSIGTHGAGGTWKLGSATISTVTPNRYLRVEIEGVEYQVPAREA